MRTRINVTFEAGTRSISSGIENLSIDDIRLIINETQKMVLCSSMQKKLIASISNGVVTYVESYQKVMPNGDVQTIVIPVLATGDHITFEIDRGNVIAVLTEISSQDIENMCDDIINGDNNTDNNME